MKIKMKNRDKGFTLIEILIAIAIIAVLFSIFIPQVNGFYTKARETGIKNDFRNFQISSESHFREVGKHVYMDILNMYLDNKHEIIEKDAVMKTSSQDSWGTPYEVEFGIGKIMFASYGKERDMSDKKYIVATYYHNDFVASCTSGFSTNNIELTIPNLPSDFVCGSDLLIAIPPKDTLDSPKNFKATNVTNTKAELSWDTVSGAMLYILKRNGTTIYSGTNHTFSDITLHPGITYSYSVTAKSTNAMSPPSALNVTTDAQPTAPTGFRITNITDSSVAFSWDAVPVAVSYVLKRDGIIVYTGGNTTFNDTGLSGYTSYTYSLVAQNSSGQSGPVFLNVKTLANDETVKLPDSGTGSCSPYNPYIITTVGELQGMKLDLSGCFELGNNINANKTSTWNGGKGFEPIGSSFDFTGKLDGKNYKITDLTINRPNENDIGLFGSIKGEAKNIHFENANIIGNNYVGSLAGAGKESTISNIEATGNIEGIRSVGSVLGLNTGNIITVSSEASVYGSNMVGGILGENYGMINDAILKGNVIGTYSAAGGIVGFNSGEVNNVSATADTTVSGVQYVGGVIGYSEAELNNATSEATVNGDRFVGGVIGLNYASAKKLTSEAVVNGRREVGGVIGENYGGVNELTSKAKVTGLTEEIGGVVGYNEGVVSNAVATILTNVNGDRFVGGIIGYNLGVLDTATSDSTVNGVSEVGGVIGENWGDVQNTFSKGNVTGTSHEVGGLVGFNSGTLGTSTSEAIVNGSIDVGGLIGLNNGEIDDVSSEATVIGVSNVGGIVGDNHGFISNVLLKASAKVTGYDFVGGITGHNDVSTKSASAEGAIIKGVNKVGGLIGYSNGILDTGTSEATVNGERKVGGVIGDNYGDVMNITSKAIVTGTDEQIGGVLGYNVGDATNLIATANVVVTGGWLYTGGIIGFNEGTLESSTSQAVVNGENFVGGVIGENQGDISNITSKAIVAGTNGQTGGIIGYNEGNITNSSSTSSVTGYIYVGGLVGQNDNGATISRSYAAGNVSGTLHLGGLVGLNTGTVSSSYYDINTTGKSDTGKGIGKTTAEMKNQATYVGWDFVNVWKIEPMRNDGYPYLRSFASVP